MGVFQDITGQRFGRLVAIKRVGSTKLKESIWQCQCDCGNIADVSLTCLKRGNTRSCGCLQREFQDLTGQRFGRLVVIKRDDTVKGNVAWLCKCDCGNTSTPTSHSLTSGLTRSCGCLHREISSKTKSGFRRKGTRLYRIWTGMKTRCYNSANKLYSYYGGRGITICDEWRDDFAVFRDWALSNGYRDDLTIERIDVNGNYCPENCRWITQAEQMRNTRKNHMIEMDGERKTLSEWARQYNIRCGAVVSRLKRGWTPERALKTPSLRKGQNGE